MFMGTYQHNIDAKGRLSLPAPFRDIISGLPDQRLVLSSHFDGCLVLYTLQEWTLLNEKAKNLPTMNKTVKKFNRFTFSRAQASSLDRQGRILISPMHREFAALEGETYLIGISNKVEIWNRERWAKEDAEITANPEDIQDAMAELGM